MPSLDQSSFLIMPLSYIYHTLMMQSSKRHLRIHGMIHNGTQGNHTNISHGYVYMSWMALSIKCIVTVLLGCTHWWDSKAIVHVLQKYPNHALINMYHRVMRHVQYIYLTNIRIIQGSCTYHTNWFQICALYHCRIIIHSQNSLYMIHVCNHLVFISTPQRKGLLSRDLVEWGARTDWFVKSRPAFIPDKRAMILRTNQSWIVRLGLSRIPATSRGHQVDLQDTVSLHLRGHYLSYRHPYNRPHISSLLHSSMNTAHMLNTAGAQVILVNTNCHL